MPEYYGRRAGHAREIRPRQPLHRTSPRKRGYVARWDALSKAYRQQNPFCIRCLEEDRETLIVEGGTGVVDHKHPVVDGGPMWDRSNWWGLCMAHHSGWKARLEAYARVTGQMDKIIRWCDDPAARPLLRGE